MDTAALGASPWTSSSTMDRKRPREPVKRPKTRGLAGFGHSSSDSDDQNEVSADHTFFNSATSQSHSGDDESSSDMQDDSSSGRFRPPHKKRRKLSQPDQQQSISATTTGPVSRSAAQSSSWYPSSSSAARVAAATSGTGPFSGGGDWRASTSTTAKPISSAPTAHHTVVRDRMEDMALDDDDDDDGNNDIDDDKRRSRRKRRKMGDRAEVPLTANSGITSPQAFASRNASKEQPGHLYASTIEEQPGSASASDLSQVSDASGLGFTQLPTESDGFTSQRGMDIEDEDNGMTIQHPVEVQVAPGTGAPISDSRQEGGGGWMNASNGHHVHDGPEIQDWDWGYARNSRDQGQGAGMRGWSNRAKGPKSYEIEKDRIVVTSLSDTESDHSTYTPAARTNSHAAAQNGGDDDDDIIELSRPSTSSSSGTTSEAILQPGDGSNGFILSPTYLSAMDRNALSPTDRQGLAELVRRMRSSSNNGGGPSQLQRDKQGGLIIYRRPPGFGAGPFSSQLNEIDDMQDDASSRFQVIEEDGGDAQMEAREGATGMEEDVAMGGEEVTSRTANEASSTQPTIGGDDETMEIG